MPRIVTFGSAAVLNFFLGLLLLVSEIDLSRNAINENVLKSFLTGKCCTNSQSKIIKDIIHLTNERRYV